MLRSLYNIQLQMHAVRGPRRLTLCHYGRDASCSQPEHWLRDEEYDASRGFGTGVCVWLWRTDPLLFEGICG
eukprot:2464715-Pyramimonas_sp.AAC.1